MDDALADRIARALFPLDALADERRPGRRWVLDFDNPPEPGSLVLLMRPGRAWVQVFDDGIAPPEPTWVIAVVRFLSAVGMVIVSSSGGPSS